MRFYFLSIIAVIALLGAVSFADDDYSARKAAMAPAVSPDKTMISVHNDTVIVQLDDVDGQFNMGKYADGTTLLFAYSSTPWSSWASFLIDGTFYTNNFAGGAPTGALELGGGTVAHPFTVVPHSGDSTYIYGG